MPFSTMRVPCVWSHPLLPGTGRKAPLKMEINLRNVNFPHKRVNSTLILELLLCLLFLKNMPPQNNPYAKEAYLEVAYSAILQLVSLLKYFRLVLPVFKIYINETIQFVLVGEEELFLYPSKSFWPV